MNSNGRQNESGVTHLIFEMRPSPTRGPHSFIYQSYAGSKESMLALEWTFRNSLATIFMPRDFRERESPFGGSYNIHLWK